MVYYIKVIRQFGCFYGQFADEGDNTVNKPNIYNVNGVIGCRSVYNARQQEVCWKSFFLFRAVPSLCFLYKTKHSSYKYLSYSKMFIN
jgi:hypothetical protein